MWHDVAAPLVDEAELVAEQVHGSVGQASSQAAPRMQASTSSQPAPGGDDAAPDTTSSVFDFKTVASLDRGHAESEEEWF